MDWIDIRDKLPEEGSEVLCAITKYGSRTSEPSYNRPYIDKAGKKWHRLGLQVHYALLWLEDGKWSNWDIDDYEDNSDLMFVIAWSDRLNYKLKNDED